MNAILFFCSGGSLSPASGAGEAEGLHYKSLEMFTEPVSSKDFFGRTKILELLNKRVDALKSGYRQNVALTGQMFSGKTSILRYFLKSLKDSSIIPIYIEVCEEPFPSFTDKFIANLLYNFFLSINKDVSIDIESLTRQAEAIIPCTAQAIKKIYQDISTRSYNQAYRQLLDLTSVFKEETNRPCIVILDEFHNLENFNIKNAFLHLGRIIMIQKNTMYIVSSSQRNKIRKILSEKLSLLFGNFEIIEVSGFDSKTAREFIKEKIAPLNISDYYSDYFLNVTDSNPFYLDMVSKRLKYYKESSNCERVNVELIKDVLEDLMFNENGTLHKHFMNNIHFLFDKDQRKNYLNILFALANGANRIKDIAAYFKGRDLSKNLEHLIEIDVVYKCGIFYTIQDRVFSFWLKTVYFMKKKAIIDNFLDWSSEFKKLVENDVENYLIEYNKGVGERVKELFYSFDGEIVEINNRLRKLPKFFKIEVIKYGIDKNYLACEEGNKYWICNIKHNKAEETDVIDLIQLSHNRFKNAKRKILVALGGIDSNALLLAKEKHIWVWKSNSLNSLFRLYKKYELIV